METNNRFRLPKQCYGIYNTQLYNNERDVQGTEIPKPIHNIQLLENERITYMDVLTKSLTGKYNLFSDPSYLASHYFEAYQQYYTIKRELYQKTAALRSRSLNTQCDSNKQAILQSLSIIFDDKSIKNMFRSQRDVQNAQLMLKSDPEIKYKHNESQYYVDVFSYITKQANFNTFINNSLEERIKLLSSVKKNVQQSQHNSQSIYKTKGRSVSNIQQNNHHKNILNQHQIQKQIGKYLKQQVKQNIQLSSRSHSAYPKQHSLNKEQGITQQQQEQIKRTAQQQIIHVQPQEETYIHSNQLETADSSLNMNLYLSSPMMDTNAQDLNDEPLLQSVIFKKDEVMLNNEQQDKTHSQNNNNEVLNMNQLSTKYQPTENEDNKMKAQNYLDIKIMELQQKLGFTQMNDTLYNTGQFNQQKKNVQQQSFDERYNKLKRSVMNMQTTNDMQPEQENYNDDIVQQMQRKLQQFEQNYNIIQSQTSTQLASLSY